MRLSLVLLLALGGCGVGKALGLKTTLEHKDLSALHVDLVGESALCPGSAAQLVVSATLADGSTLSTADRLSWKGLRLQATGARADEGMVTLDRDPRATYGQGGSLTVVPVGHEEQAVTIPLPVRYDCAYVADFSGERGRDGDEGHAGTQGSDGEGNGTGAGGDGTDGGRGHDGTDGEPGRAGDEVTVRISRIVGESGPLLQVEASSRTRDHVERFLVDPERGSVSIVADGGHGGAGGNGGQGGRGGMGGTGSPGGNGGRGGEGGDGGLGADGGDGGHVTLVVDPIAKDALGRVHVDVRGGPGGQHGEGGPPGSGGTTYSGGNQGADGAWGRPGARDGRVGRDAPAPEVKEEKLGSLW